VAEDFYDSYHRSTISKITMTEPIVVILFMFFGIGLGIIFMQVLNWLKDPIPYTCSVFLGGIFLSLASKNQDG